MRKEGLLIVCALASMSDFCFSQSSPGPLIQTLDPEVFNAGIGCSLRPYGQEFGYRDVFVGLDAKGNEGPWMKIDGRVLKLSRIEGSWPEKKGRKAILRFSADRTNVVVNVTNTASGTAGFYVEGTLSVSTDGGKETIRVSGGCGD